MGKITCEPQQTATSATHFSHPHPLNLLHLHQTPTASSSCSGCKLNPSGTIYSCTICDFFLHKKCFEMPPEITHPFHKKHAFTLMPVPAYAEGVFNCDACGEAGTGFSYHCKPCGIDLHILCAAAPVSLATDRHPHKLDLAFGSPYETKKFMCDVCRIQGSDHWLYRCKPCGFDAHLKCASAAPPVAGFQVPRQAETCSRSTPQPQPQPQYQHQHQSQHQQQPQGVGAQYFMAAAPPPMQQNFIPNPFMNNAALGFPAGGMVPPQFGVNRQNDTVLPAIMQMLQNNNAMTQALLAGSLGGVGVGGGFGGPGGAAQALLAGSLGGIGVGGGLGGAQQLMQMISGGLTNGGAQAGLEYSVQSLLGGGGGLDFLGGGGLEFLGGFLG